LARTRRWRRAVVFAACCWPAVVVGGVVAFFAREQFIPFVRLHPCYFSCFFLPFGAWLLFGLARFLELHVSKEASWRAPADEIGDDLALAMRKRDIEERDERERKVFPRPEQPEIGIDLMPGRGTLLLTRKGYKKRSKRP
jgi:hypothetical protein